jgi:hypothetical protein
MPVPFLVHRPLLLKLAVVSENTLQIHTYKRGNKFCERKQKKGFFGGVVALSYFHCMDGKGKRESLEKGVRGLTQAS